MLVDMAVSLAVMAIIILGAVTVSTGAREVAMARATIKGMESTLQAALVYRREHGAWPASINQLSLPLRGRETPWGQPFVFENPTTRSITLRTRLPAGLLAQVIDAPNTQLEADGTVRMTITMEGIATQDLEAENKALY